MRPQDSSGPRVRPRGEGGFTLPELLIVAIIMPLVIGALAMALISTLKLQSNASAQLTGSSQAQIVSSSYFHDLQSATGFTTSSGAPQLCGGTTGFAVGLTWPASGGSTYVTYRVLPLGGGSGSTLYQLQRDLCAPSTAMSSVTVATDVQPLTSELVTVNGYSCTLTTATEAGTCTPGAQAGSLGWASTFGIKSIVINLITANSSQSLGLPFSFTLTGLPRKWEALQATDSGTPTPPNNPPLNAPLQLLGSSGTNLSCNGNNAAITVNGQLALNSTSPPVSANGTNFFPTSTYTVYSGYTGSIPGVPSSTPNTVGGSLIDPYGTLTLGPATTPGTFESTLNTTLTSSPQYLSVASYYLTPNVVSGSSLLTGKNTKLAPGIYEITGSVNLKAGDSLSGSGVLLYFDSGGLSMIGNSSLNITPISDYLHQSTSLINVVPPISIWLPPSNSSSVTLTGNSGGNLVGGLVYAPASNVSLQGNSGGAGSLGVNDILSKSLSCNGSITATIYGPGPVPAGS